MKKKHLFVLSLFCICTVIFFAGCDSNSKSLINKNKADISVAFYGEDFVEEVQLGDIKVTYDSIEANTQKKFNVVFFSDDYVKNKLAENVISEFEQLMNNNYVLAYYSSSADDIRSFARKFGKTAIIDSKSVLRGVILYKDVTITVVPSYIITSKSGHTFTEFVSTTIYSTITEFKSNLAE